MKPIFEWYKAQVTAGARVWRVPVQSGTRTFPLIMSEGNLRAPTDAEVLALPSVANGRYSFDDARNMILTSLNAGQLAIETVTGRYFWGHPTDVYPARQVTATREELAIRGWLIGRAIPPNGSMSDFVKALGGQVVARARYGGATTEGQFMPELLNTLDAGGNVTGFRSWDAGNVPDGWAEVNCSAGAADSDRYLIWFGPGRGGFRVHNFNSADTGPTDWAPNACYYMAETGTGSVSLTAHLTRPQIIPDALSAQLRAYLVKRDPLTLASGPAGHFSTGLVLQGVWTLPLWFSPQFGAATRYAVGADVYAADLLAWPGRPLAFQEPGCVDGVIRVSGRLMADYFRRATGRADAPLALPPDQEAAVERMRVSGDVYVHQWSTRGFLVRRLQDWSGEFADAEGSATLIPKTNRTPRLTITDFNSKWVGQRITGLMGAASHGPQQPPISVGLHGVAGLEFHDPISDVRLVVDASTDATVNQALELVGDSYLWASADHSTIQSRMGTLGLAVLTDQLNPPDAERRYEDVFPLLPNMADATGTAQADAFLSMGVNMNEHLVRAAIAMRQAELAHVREMKRRYDEAAPVLAVTP